MAFTEAKEVSVTKMANVKLIVIARITLALQAHDNYHTRQRSSPNVSKRVKSERRRALLTPPA